MAKKIALVLSGGGAKGAFQVSAERYAREQKGYEWTIIAGVSAGALNGGMLAMEKYQRLADLWDNISNDKVYTGRLNRWAIIKMFFGARSALSNKPLEKLIDEEFEPHLITKDLRVGVVSLTTGNYAIFKPTDVGFTKAVLASTAIPIAWPPVTLPPPFGDAVDGGLRNVSPLGDVLDADPDEIVIINCSPREPKALDKTLRNALDIGKRSLDIAVNEIFVGDLREFLRININVKEAAEKDVILHNEKGKAYKYFECKIIGPEHHLGDSLDFSQGAVQHSLNAGLQAAKAALG